SKCEGCNNHYAVFAWQMTERGVNNRLSHAIQFRWSRSDGRASARCGCNGAHHQQHYENQEQDFGYACSSAGDSTEAKYTCNQSQNEKCQCPGKHVEISITVVDRMARAIIELRRLQGELCRMYASERI